MNQEAINYVRALKSAGMPDGESILEKGREIGRTITMKRSHFLEQNGYDTYEDFVQENIREGKITWEIFMGLATLEEQKQAIKDIYEFVQRTGCQLNTIEIISSPLMALPKEYRETAAKPTSFTMDKTEDWLEMQTAPIELIFADHHLASPNALESTINAVKAGSPRVGLVAQFFWGQQGFTNHRQHMIDFVTSLGIVSSKYDDHISVDSYMDDGFPGYAMDCVTYVGYALLEHYIVHDLCHVRYQTGLGGLLKEQKSRAAIAVAIHQLLSTEEQRAISYMNGSTVTQWEHDIKANFGSSGEEIMFDCLVERHYKMGMALNTIGIAERIAVPTAQDLMDICSVGNRALEGAKYWEDMLDWSSMDEIVEYLKAEGKLFFENTLKVLEAAGINIKDPLEIFMTLKSMNPNRFEKTFHHRVGENGTLTPKYPTVLGRQTVEMREEIVADIKSKGVQADALAGKKVVVVSGDGHTYGIVVVDAVLSEMGAEVVNGGVDIDPPTALDLADEEGTKYIGISVHNGQGLDYAKQILELAAKRKKEYHIFMGGKLNAILPGDSVPTEVADKICDLGILATEDLYEQVCMIRDTE